MDAEAACRYGPHVNLNTDGFAEHGSKVVAPIAADRTVDAHSVAITVKCSLGAEGLTPKAIGH
jgi:hypothetical protein